jgi:hypothetical protein
MMVGSFAFPLHAYPSPVKLRLHRKSGIKAAVVTFSAHLFNMPPSRAYLYLSWSCSEARTKGNTDSMNSDCASCKQEVWNCRFASQDEEEGPPNNADSPLTIENFTTTVRI